MNFGFHLSDYAWCPKCGVIDWSRTGPCRCDEGEQAETEGEERMRIPICTCDLDVLMSSGCKCGGK